MKEWACCLLKNEPIAEFAQDRTDTPLKILCGSYCGGVAVIACTTAEERPSRCQPTSECKKTMSIRMI